MSVNQVVLNSYTIYLQYKLIYLIVQLARTYSFTQLAQVAEGDVVMFVAVAILSLETLQVAEVMVVDDADEPIQLLDVVLQRSGGQEQFVAIGKGSLQPGGHRRSGLVYIPQLVGLVIYHKVPLRARQEVGLPGGKLIGTNENLAAGRERVQREVFFLFENQGREKELVLQLHAPLAAERGGSDNQDAAPVLGPKLADDDSGLDGLAQSHFVGQDHALGEWGLKRKKGRHHLMGVQVDTCLGQDTCQLVVVRTAPVARQLPRIIQQLRR